VHDIKFVLQLILNQLLQRQHLILTIAHQCNSSAYCSTNLKFSNSNSSRRDKTSSAAFPGLLYYYCSNCDTLLTFLRISDSKCSNVTQAYFLSGYGPQEHLSLFLFASS